MAKEGQLEKAKTTFQGTDVTTTEEGKRYLGSAIGKRSFLETYICKTKGRHMGGGIEKIIINSY